MHLQDRRRAYPSKIGTRVRRVNGVRQWAGRFFGGLAPKLRAARTTRFVAIAAEISPIELERAELAASVAGDLFLKVNWFHHRTKVGQMPPVAKRVLPASHAREKLPVVKPRALAPVFFRMAEPNPAAPADGPQKSPPPASPSKGVIFFRRLGSSVALWSFVLLALFIGRNLVGDVLFLMVMLMIAMLGLEEFYVLVTKAGFDCFRKWGLVGGILLMTSTFLYVQGGLRDNVAPSKANDFETGILILFVLGLCFRQFMSKKGGSGLLRISTTLFGLMYVPWLLNFIQKLHFFPAVMGEDGQRVTIDGNYYVLYFILVTKFSDLGAYVTGSLIGKHKMIPRISPGKTWEGFGGAIVISTLVSVVFAHFLEHKLYGMNLMHAIILGVLLSVSAVVGDLIESIFKREAGVKDSGTWFPGIGGILDLMDSLLFNAPLMYLYLRHVLTH
jgi:phosphatidate cytidylyltransferase